MQYKLLSYLKCPASKASRRFQLIRAFIKEYDSGPVREIREGILFSEARDRGAGFLFPRQMHLPYI